MDSDRVGQGAVLLYHPLCESVRSADNVWGKGLGELPGTGCV